MKDQKKKDIQNNSEVDKVHKATACINRRDFLKVIGTLGMGSLFATACKQEKLEQITNEATQSPAVQPSATIQEETVVAVTPAKISVPKEGTNTPEPTENIDYLRVWGPLVLGECGVPFLEQLVRIENVDRLVVGSNDEVTDKGENYQLSEGEETLTARIVDRFNSARHSDNYGNILNVEEKNVEIGLFHMEGKDFNGNNTYAPLVLISFPDPNDAIISHSFLELGLSDSLEFVPPGKEGEDAKAFIKLIQSGTLENEGKFTIGIPLSADPATEEGRTMASPPLFEVIKDESNKIRIGFTMPPFLDVVKAGLEKPERDSFEKKDLSDNVPAIKVMAALVPNEIEIQILRRKNESELKTEGPFVFAPKELLRGK